jgi:hypothetical protein
LDAGIVATEDVQLALDETAVRPGEIGKRPLLADIPDVFRGAPYQRLNLFRRTCGSRTRRHHEKGGTEQDADHGTVPL